MHITPPPDLRPIKPLASRPAKRRRLLRPMLVGSVLLHVLLLLALYLRWPPDDAPETPPADSDAVAITFDTPTGSQQASTATPNPADKPTTASGSAAAPETQPAPNNASAPPPAPTPPTPEPQPPAPAPAPPTPAPPTPAPPDPAPPVTAETPPPTPPPPAPVPPTPSTRPPATVSLNPDDEGPLPPPPAFQMPQPPPPLPPLPRPAPPRVASRPTPRNPFAAPQNWSFNAAPSQNAPGRPSRGFDMSPATQGGPDTASLGYVSGAKPSGDWMSALRKWVDARKYYPEQAIAQLQQGSVTLMIDIDRSGKVLQVRLADTSQSQFLDGAFEDLFRRAVVPPFTPDMTDQTTTLRATMHFRLITH